MDTVPNFYDMSVVQRVRWLRKHGVPNAQRTDDPNELAARCFSVFVGLKVAEREREIRSELTPQVVPTLPTPPLPRAPTVRAQQEIAGNVPSEVLPARRTRSQVALDDFESAPVRKARKNSKVNRSVVPFSAPAAVPLLDEPFPAVSAMPIASLSSSPATPVVTPVTPVTGSDLQAVLGAILDAVHSIGNRGAAAYETAVRPSSPFLTPVLAAPSPAPLALPRVEPVLSHFRAVSSPAPSPAALPLNHLSPLAAPVAPVGQVAVPSASPMVVDDNWRGKVLFSQPAVETSFSLASLALDRVKAIVSKAAKKEVNAEKLGQGKEEKFKESVDQYDSYFEWFQRWVATSTAMARDPTAMHVRLEFEAVVIAAVQWCQDWQVVVLYIQSIRREWDAAETAGILVTSPDLSRFNPLHLNNCKEAWVTALASASADQKRLIRAYLALPGVRDSPMVITSRALSMSPTVNSTKAAARDQDEGICFYCGKVGHRYSKCNQLRSDKANSSVGNWARAKPKPQKGLKFSTGAASSSSGSSSSSSSSAAGAAESKR